MEELSPVPSGTERPTPAGIDTAIDAAARALCHERGVHYDRLDGQWQARWRGDAQVVVSAWLEDRRQVAEESVSPREQGLLDKLAALRAEVAELRRAAADELSRLGQGMDLGGPRRVDDLDVAEAMLTNLRDADQSPGGRPAGGAAPIPDPEAIDRAARLMCDRYDANRLTWSTADEEDRKHWRRQARAVAGELGLPAPASAEKASSPHR